MNTYFLNMNVIVISIREINPDGEFRNYYQTIYFNNQRVFDMTFYSILRIPRTSLL
jgi:hypothetical protein